MFFDGFAFGGCYVNVQGKELGVDERNAAKKVEILYPEHVKVDTGLSRILDELGDEVEQTAGECNAIVVKVSKLEKELADLRNVSKMNNMMIQGI